MSAISSAYNEVAALADRAARVIANGRLATAVDFSAEKGLVVVANSQSHVLARPFVVGTSNGRVVVAGDCNSLPLF